MTEIQHADPGARRWAVVLIVLGTAAGLVLIPLAESSRPALEAWVRDDLDVHLRLVANGLAVAFGGPTLFMAVYCWRLGARIVGSSRFPLPGMRVIRDTIVLHGQQAWRRGRALQVLAVILLLTVVGFSMVLWRLVALLESPTA